MRERLLPYLACPDCEAGLRVEDPQYEGPEIVCGRLRCDGCDGLFPVVRGVPRLVSTDPGDGAGPSPEPVELRTAEAFGYEWTRYSDLAERYRRQFLDWIRPVEPGFFRDKAVLEGGCGKGRHSRLAAEFGARDVVALDLGPAVEIAHSNTRHLPNVHVVQADLKRPPVRRVFDYGFSIGVLHHMPAPEEGFRALVSRVRPGGHVSAWVYGREGNGWIVHLVSPLRERLTSRLPHAVLDALSAVAAIPVFLATKTVYGPTGGRILGRRLPYGDYLSYISDFPWREQRSIVFDHLVTPIAHYVRRDEFAGWFRRAHLEAVEIAHHNANSWRGFGRVPEPAPDPDGSVPRQGRGPDHIGSPRATPGTG